VLFTPDAEATDPDGGGASVVILFFVALPPPTDVVAINVVDVPPTTATVVVMTTVPDSCVKRNFLLQQLAGAELFFSGSRRIAIGTEQRRKTEVEISRRTNTLSSTPTPLCDESDPQTKPVTCRELQAKNGCPSRSTQPPARSPRVAQRGSSMHPSAESIPDRSSNDAQRRTAVPKIRLLGMWQRAQTRQSVSTLTTDARRSLPSLPSNARRRHDARAVLMQPPQHTRRRVRRPQRVQETSNGAPPPLPPPPSKPDESADRQQLVDQNSCDRLTGYRYVADVRLIYRSFIDPITVPIKARLPQLPHGEVRYRYSQRQPIPRRDDQRRVFPSLIGSVRSSS
jgi:hypothetical protein